MGCNVVGTAPPTAAMLAPYSARITGSAVALHCVKARGIGKVKGEAKILTPCKIYTP